MELGDFYDDLEESPSAKKKVGPGRPRGSKNRTSEAVEVERKVRRAFSRIRPFCTAEQRAYLDQIEAGTAEMDTLKEFEIMIRQLTLAFSEASDTVMDTGSTTKEYAELANALRMSLKDSEDIRKARRLQEDKETSKEAQHLDDVREERARLDSVIANGNMLLEATKVSPSA